MKNTMKATINERILMLKTQLGLSNLEFCHAANISNGTLHNVQNGENVSPKTIKTIIESLNLNKEWLINGKGEIYLQPVKDEKSNLTKAIELLEQQLAKKDEQIADLLAVFKKVNFLNAIGDTPLTKYLPGKRTNSVRAAA
jgi:transcriptional regulator with XRE-family HTH domain